MVYTLRQARRLADKTQSEAAKAIGVCEHTYRKMEKDPSSITIKHAFALSSFFGVPYDQIFFGSNSN